MHASVDARARRAAGDGGAGRGCAGATGVERGSPAGTPQPGGQGGAVEEEAVARW